MKITKLGDPISMIVSDEYYELFPYKNYETNNGADNQLNEPKVLSKYLLFLKKQNTINKEPVPKVLKLRKLKFGGTTIINDSGRKKYFYYPLKTVDNPCVTICNNIKKGYNIELIINPGSSKVYLPDLPINKDHVTENVFDPDANHLKGYTSSDPDYYDKFPAVVSGKLKFTVYQDNFELPLFLTNLDINLKCFSNEYINITHIDSHHNLSRKNENSEEFDKKLNVFKSNPRVNLDFLNYKNINKNMPKGVYEFPFDFILNCKESPATNCYYGSIQYRIEAISKIFYEKTGYFDTVILTDLIEVKKVLPIDSEYLINNQLIAKSIWSRIGCKEESLVLKSYDNLLISEEFDDSLFAEVNIPSRILDSSILGKFSAILNVDKSFENLKITKISLNLSQAVSLPSIDNISFEPTKNSEHIQHSNEFRLLKKIITDDKPDDKIVKVEFDLNNISELLSLKRTIMPYYCERSSMYKNMASLKVTHKLLFRIYLFPIKTTLQKSNISEYCIRIAVPILLLDDSMLNNLVLPSYEFENSTHL
ncbi:hypothetical protein TPHA_0B02570 [Tetrapisispora phaffii CBS 4417]|uniref:Arrestin-like N-terminal domain-containing protein n=1 Tax=Tetrapisispora phaffii (strain ATCC 24235 / CBS 4417 / NBRC 1672 / NRRL Y-8282 / UCD 70-5) TaxID=1071381 RepID=G8BPJ9_TETPH|nr:hypothetical protein TPHA_0B02570 [Tetrapisispora phaffii CBS 4417]CCE61930.1 hypothetical protein TPHA_0B02570 [Tetrapisispora phaffii CBS 4417]